MRLLGAATGRRGGVHAGIGTIHVTTTQPEQMRGSQVTDSMVGPEGFEPPTKGL